MGTSLPVHSIAPVVVPVGRLPPTPQAQQMTTATASRLLIMGGDFRFGLVRRRPIASAVPPASASLRGVLRAGRLGKPWPSHFFTDVGGRTAYFHGMKPLGSRSTAEEA